ncbi:hypothetical protein ACIBO1_29705 [Micromonospora sp. NPDC049903]|uniref:hypothetical protein n=1 Tax=Micromonospora sp. NPDC049903 TaxID=3364276 RepID=UPI00378CA694
MISAARREWIFPFAGLQPAQFRHHRTVRAQVEHVLARMKCFKIPLDYRRAAHTLTRPHPVSLTSAT